jgi:hypothetical protein
MILNNLPMINRSTGSTSNGPNPPILSSEEFIFGRIVWTNGSAYENYGMQNAVLANKFKRVLIEKSQSGIGEESLQIFRANGGGGETISSRPISPKYRIDSRMEGRML